MREFRVNLGGRDLTFIRRMSHGLEPGKASCFGRLRACGKVFLIASALVFDKIGTASNGTVIADIDNVKNKRRVYGKRGVQAGRVGHCFKSDAGNKRPTFGSRFQRKTATIAGNDKRESINPSVFTCRRSTAASTPRLTAPW